VIAAPPVALSASPAHVAIGPRQTQQIQVTNAGRTTAIVFAAPAGLALAPRGRPRAVARSHPAWLHIRPARLALAPGQVGTIAVSATAAAPGDHPALLLLQTRSADRGTVAVRMQIGIVVVLRVPGAVRHDLRLRAVRATARGLELVVANRGNVTEQLANVRVRLLRRGSVVARLRLQRRELLPHSAGIAAVVLPRRLHGAFTLAALGRRFRVRAR
jgi:hypothetical protein